MSNDSGIPDESGVKRVIENNRVYCPLADKNISPGFCGFSGCSHFKHISREFLNISDIPPGGTITIDINARDGFIDYVICKYEKV